MKKHVFKIAIAGMLLGMTASAQAATDLPNVPKRGSGEESCFVREYSPAHLEAHPAQILTKVAVHFEAPAEYPDQLWATILGKKRGTKRVYQNGGSCVLKHHELRCMIECDGGNFALRVKGDESLWLEIIDQVALVGCDDQGEPVEYLNIPDDAENALYRVDHTDLSRCDAKSF